MEKSLKFNSQVCTTKEQSQRLLRLGLKPETADMCIDLYNEDEPFAVQNKIDYSKQIEFVPAWSLHRLMEIAEMDCFNNVATAYDEVIGVIKFQHGEGYINKEYLKQ